MSPASHASDFQLPSSKLKKVGYDMSKEVDVELVLAVDISQSMDTDEQEVQRAGYVDAITSPEFLQAVQYGPLGRIAITYIEWGGIGQHYTVANWSVIDNADTAEAFASSIAEAPLRQVRRTSISAALAHSVQLFDANEYNGLRKVIDISGDGPNNQGGSVTRARDLSLQTGVTINGLPLMMSDKPSTWQSVMNLDHYYEDCVIGGPGSFAIPVRSKQAFAAAIRMKLVMEIAGLTFEKPLVHRASARKRVRCSLFN
ncbi:MAG: DUF1194 domain-containing protein [Rhodobacteraceae bacterium]|nr:DUF1194 domain-containing protein [Paracoccaceae bacterium]